MVGICILVRPRYAQPSKRMMKAPGQVMRSCQHGASLGKLQEGYRVLLAKGIRMRIFQVQLRPATYHRELIDIVIQRGLCLSRDV